MLSGAELKASTCPDRKPATAGAQVNPRSLPARGTNPLVFTKGLNEINQFPGPRKIIFDFPQGGVSFWFPATTPPLQHLRVLVDPMRACAWLSPRSRRRQAHGGAGVRQKGGEPREEFAT